MNLLVNITVGALPDMIEFGERCDVLLSANEGEAGTDQFGRFLNPEGSVSVIDIAGAIRSAPDVRLSFSGLG